MIETLKKNKHETLVAGIYTRQALSPDKAVRLVLSVYAMGRPFSELDRAIMVQKLHERLSFTPREIARLLAEYFDFPESLPRVEDYLQISHLSKPLRSELHSGRLHRSEALLLARIMPEEDREKIFFQIQSTFKPGRNIFREILELLLEISVLKETTPLAILTDVMAAARGGERHVDGARHRGGGLLSTLRKIRYPVITRERERFNRRCARLHLPAGVELSRGSRPEDTSLRIQFTARDEAHLRALISRLGDLVSSGGFRNLFDYQEDDENEP